VWYNDFAKAWIHATENGHTGLTSLGGRDGVAEVHRDPYRCEDPENQNFFNCRWEYECGYVGKLTKKGQCYAESMPADINPDLYVWKDMY